MDEIKCIIENGSFIEKILSILENIIKGNLLNIIKYNILDIKALINIINDCINKKICSNNYYN